MDEFIYASTFTSVDNYKKQNEMINSFLSNNDINITMYLFDSDKLYISNRNNDAFYDIILKKYQNTFNYEIISIRNVVRHDDSVVSNLNKTINCGSSDLYNVIQNLNIMPDDKLKLFINFIHNTL